MYEWKGIKKLYAHIIRQIENGLSTWSQDFSGVETPLLIKYVKTDKATTPFYVNDDKKVTQRDDTVIFIVPIIREGSGLKTLLTMGKLKG